MLGSLSRIKAERLSLRCSAFIRDMVISETLMDEQTCAFDEWGTAVRGYSDCLAFDALKLAANQVITFAGAASQLWGIVNSDVASRGVNQAGLL